MKSKTKFLFISIISVAIALSFYLKQSAEGAIGAAHSFIKQIQNGDTTAAYGHLSPAMQVIASSDELSEFVEINQLQSANVSEWKSLNKNAAREVLMATVSSTDNVAKPLVAVFSNGQENWHLDAMLFPQEPEADKLKSVTPNMLQMLDLVSNAVQDFAVSLNARNMQHFHNAISKLWRDQADPAQLQQAFQGFFDANLDLTVLAEVKPVINGIPEQDDKGVITVSGFFPTRPSKLAFEQRFIWEGFSWKLVGFTANIN